MPDEPGAVALIPARGGSKGVPRKNVREVGGKPLLQWSVETALETTAVDDVFVTTDDAEIARVARDARADVIDRPSHLATDDALVADVVRHAIEALRERGDLADEMVLLEPTCPFRDPQDVQAALELLREEALDSVASFAPAELNPGRAWRIEDANPSPVLDDVDPWQSRQSLLDAYQLNGGVYAFVVDALPEAGHALLFGDVGAISMPPERSVDIDTPLDLELARLIASKEHRELESTDR